ncbi:MAG: hypothetical protein R3F55_14295 [Alphaproteobacteria bacterium]
MREDFFARMVRSMRSGVRIVVPAAAVALALAGCQSNITQRQAPTPAQLYGGAVQPVSGPVLLRYRPVGPVQLSGTVQASADVSSYHFDKRDALSGNGRIEASGEGLIALSVTFSVGAHELTEELDVQPFTLDLLMTDLGEIKDADFSFASADRLTDSERTEIIETIISLFPIFQWPETAIQPGEPFTAVNFAVTRGNTVMRETGDLALRIDGETTYDGRRAYLIGFSGRAQGTSGDNAISGYYVIDAQSGLMLERRFTGRDKDYFQQHIVYRDYDVESHIRF